MNTIDKILDILEYIERHPSKDAMLSDLRMTDTNDFQPLLLAARSAELVDINNDAHIWYREDDLKSYGYIHEDDRLDVDITEIIDHVNRSEKDYTVIERSILSKLVDREREIHDACHSNPLTGSERDILQALQDDGVI